jgi:hypothetical protein
VIPTAVTYRLVDDGRAIECLRCGMVSYHPEDVRQRYCGHCHRFHDDPIAAIWDPKRMMLLDPDEG